MILAAGFGTRLGEITKCTPKCLVQINSRPIIRLVAEHLYKSGVRQIVVNLHYLAEQVQQYCSSSLTDLFSSIEFSYEPEILGTGGGLKAAQRFFSDQKDFYLVNADIYCNYNLENLKEKHISLRDSLGVLAVMQREDSSYLQFDQNNIFRSWITSKDLQSKDNNQLITKAFCGVQCLSAGVFKYLNKIEAKSFSLIEAYCLAQSAGEKLYAQDIGDADWFDMGTLSQLELLRNKLKESSIQ